jgi:nitrogen fixation NifU-like protein
MTKISDDHIIDHYKYPSYKGILENPSVDHNELNTSCGDNIHLYLELDPANGGTKITDVRWEGAGCSISQASMSLLSETLIGKTISDIEKLSPQDINHLLQIPIGARRIKCANLSLLCLKNCIHIYKHEDTIGFNELLKN